MKQYITIEQSDELNDKQNKKLTGWIIEHGYAMEYFANAGCLSIGQMIEFLDEHGEFVSFDKLSVDEFILNDGGYSFKANEPADALWEACKEVLEK